MFRTNLYLFRSLKLAAITLGCLLFIWGCQSKPMTPISTASHVDLDRFMGDWYVIAHIPTFIEKRAYNAIEHYSRADNGNIDTRFTFHQGSFDGEFKTYEPTGFVVDSQTNAVWKMQFVWPFKADYRIVHIDDAYEHTIIGRNARDYVWIMARSPHISDSAYEALVQKVVEEGYDVTALRKVPHNG